MVLKNQKKKQRRLRTPQRPNVLRKNELISKDITKYIYFTKLERFENVVYANDIV